MPNKMDQKRKHCMVTSKRISSKSKKKNASEVSCKVANILLSGDIPCILPPTSYTTEDVQDLVHHSTLMMNLIMNKVVNDQYLSELERSIKVFLTKFVKFDNNLQINKKDKPIWISSYNYLCLLNLPKIAKNFGPLRNIWEGGYVGEGYLRLVKPYITRGLSKNWHNNVHRGLLERKVFSYICKDYTKIESNIPKNYHCYKDIDEVRSKLLRSHVLSCIYYKNGNICFVLKNKTVILLYLSKFHSKCNSLHYYEIKHSDLNIHISECNDDCIQSYCLLLPKLDKNGLPDEFGEDTSCSIYTIISSDWKKLSMNKLME